MKNRYLNSITKLKITGLNFDKFFVMMNLNDIELFDLKRLSYNELVLSVKQYDYSKFIINEKKGVTIADLYHDDEERYNAMMLIGQRIPELQYVDSKDQTIELRNLGQSRYILEFVQPTCNWCKGMVDMLNEYRATENAYSVIGLSIVDGDMSPFNKENETTFRLKRKDETTNQFTDTIPWVPTFLFVENGNIRFVSFGNIESLEKFQEYIDLAFN